MRNLRVYTKSVCAVTADLSVASICICTDGDAGVYINYFDMSFGKPLIYTFFKRNALLAYLEGVLPVENYQFSGEDLCFDRSHRYALTFVEHEGLIVERI